MIEELVYQIAENLAASMLPKDADTRARDAVVCRIANELFHCIASMDPPKYEPESDPVSVIDGQYFSLAMRGFYAN